MWEKLVNCIKGGAVAGGGKKRCQTVLLSDLKNQVPPNQQKQFKIFAQKHEEYKARVNKYPNSLPTIDWVYYRQNVRPEFVDWVKSYEAKYDKLHTLFENRHAMVDHKRYFDLVDKESEVVKEEIKAYKEESNERIAELTEKREFLENLQSYEQMTMEEFCIACPHMAPDYINKPTFWPHTPEEQLPGPSDPKAAAALHEEHEPPEPPEAPQKTSPPPAAPKEPAAVAATEKPPGDTKKDVEATGPDLAEKATILAKNLVEKATVLFYTLKEKVSGLVKNVQKKAEAAKAARAESEPSTSLSPTTQESLDRYAERDNKSNICTRTIIRSEEEELNPDVKTKHGGLYTEADPCDPCDPCELKDELVCEAQPDPCELKEEPVCEPQPDPCEKVCDPCELKEEPVCDPCELKEEEPVCDPCELKEEPVCDPCELKEEEPVCDPCELKEEEPVCDPCELKEEPVCDPCALKEEEPVCDPCELKEEKLVCDPCEFKEEEPVCDPCELKKEESVCEPDPCKLKEDESGEAEKDTSSDPKSEDDSTDSEDTKEPEQFYISISKCSEELHKREQEKKSGDKPKECASLGDQIVGMDQITIMGKQDTDSKDPKSDEKSTIRSVDEVGRVYTDPNQIAQLLANEKKAKELRETQLKVAKIEEAVKGLDDKPLTIYPRREISAKLKSPAETIKSPRELAKEVRRMAKSAASLISQATNTLDDLKKNKEVRLENLEQAYISAHKHAREALTQASKAVIAAGKLAQRSREATGEVSSQDQEAVAMAEKHAVLAKMLANRAVALKEEIGRVLKDLKKKE